jgi:hypothetical protein
MHCPYCAKEIEEGSITCKYCGKAVMPIPTIQIAPASTNTPNPGRGAEVDVRQLKAIQGSHEWIRQGKSIAEAEKEKQEQMEARYGRKIYLESFINDYELIQKHSPGTFTMYAADGKAYVIGKMQPPPSHMADIYKSRIQSGKVLFVCSCHTYPTYPITYLRIVVPGEAGLKETVSMAILESPTDFTNANFQEWVCTLETTKKVLLKVYDENGNVLWEGGMEMDEELINKVVHTVDQANAALAAIPKERRDFQSAAQAFFRDHPQPFIDGGLLTAAKGTDINEQTQSHVLTSAPIVNMGRIAQIQVECPKCKKITNIFVEESENEKTNVNCEYCKEVFEFGASMRYRLIGYIPQIPIGGKITGSEAIESVGAGQLFPTSRYITMDKTLAYNILNGIKCWIQLLYRKDGLISQTTHRKPPQPFIQFRFLVQNTDETSIKVSAIKPILTMKNKKRLSIFLGENWDSHFVWGEPCIIEINGIDCSMRHLKEVVLNKSNYAVGEVAFPMAKRFRENEAIDLCKKFELPIIYSDNHKQVVIPLELHTVA